MAEHSRIMVPLCPVCEQSMSTSSPRNSRFFPVPKSLTFECKRCAVIATTSELPLADNEHMLQQAVAEFEAPAKEKCSRPFHLAFVTVQVRRRGDVGSGGIQNGDRFGDMPMLPILLFLTVFSTPVALAVGAIIMARAAPRTWRPTPPDMAT